MELVEFEWISSFLALFFWVVGGHGDLESSSVKVTYGLVITFT